MGLCFLKLFGQYYKKQDFERGKNEILLRRNRLGPAGNRLDRRGAFLSGGRLTASKERQKQACAGEKGQPCKTLFCSAFRPDDNNTYRGGNRFRADFIFRIGRTWIY